MINITTQARSPISGAAALDRIGPDLLAVTIPQAGVRLLDVQQLVNVARAWHSPLFEERWAPVVLKLWERVLRRDTMCIFNSDGTPELNQGAEEYVDLEHIEVKSVPQHYGFNITLHGKRHLNNPPLVSALDVNLFPEKVERGKGFDWNIFLVPRSTASMVIDDAGMDTKTVYRFKVEIVH
jgi:hypothetical protein